MKVHNPTKSDVRIRSDGHLNKGYLYTRLRKTNLKECKLVRYADDFKIFCKSYGDAVKLKYATEKWLKARLKLEISEEKSKITNLEKNYSDFLGIKFKLYRKGGRWVVRSHMSDKALKIQKENLKMAAKKAVHPHKDESDQHKALIAYNQKVVGMHEYYSMATMICADVHELFISIDQTIKSCSHYSSYTKEPPNKLRGGMDEYFYDKYKSSKQLRYLNGMIIVPVAYCRMKIPMCHSRKVNRYTPEGRECIHSMLRKADYGDVLIKLGKDKVINESIEYHDNRLSRFVACRGKCELTKIPLLFEEVACHRLIPFINGGTDEYKNLRIIHKNVEELVYADNRDIISELICKIGRENLKSAQIRKLNEWREKVGNEPISLN